MSRIKNTLLVALSILALVSCKTPKDITYVQNLNNGETLRVKPQSYIVAEPNDRISIIVHSKDPQLAEIFNKTNLSTRGGGGSNNNNMSPYFIDPLGDIEFPIIGTVHVAGLTRYEIADKIKNELIGRQLLKDPTVTVEFLDHSFTALGAFGAPGRKTFDRDNLTIIEAIGLAGDLQLSGMRKNVKVIRREDNVEKAYEIDLTDANSIYSSPVFYIQQNDVLYVEPNNTMKRSTTPNGSSFFTPGFWMGITSFALSLILLFIKL